MCDITQMLLNVLEEEGVALEPETRERIRAAVHKRLRSDPMASQKETTMNKRNNRDAPPN